MKNILNLALGIQNGHFSKCPQVKVWRRVEEDPTCHCEKKSYKIALNIGISIFVLELFGGILTHSLSLVGDSLHLLADSVAVIIGLVVIWAVAQNKKKEDSYRKRAVIVNGSLLLFSSAYLLFESFQKFRYHSCPAGLEMTVIAVIGIIGNFLQYYLLASVKGNSHKHDLFRTSILLHFFTDILQSIAVVVGGLAIITITDFKIACLIDPFISTGIGFVMLMFALNLLIKVSQPHDDHHHDHGHHHHH